MTTIPHASSISLAVYSPETPEAKSQQARQVSEFHAAAVIQRIRALPCPTAQKRELLDAILDTIKTRSRDQT